jgi:hypothetical protein
MFNPLLPDPTRLKDQDLESKILDLSKKYHIAMRLGNGSVAQQIILTLDTLKVEQQRRQMENMTALQQKSRDQGLDDLINVD